MIMCISRTMSINLFREGTQRDRFEPLHVRASGRVAQNTSVFASVDSRFEAEHRSELIFPGVHLQLFHTPFYSCRGDGWVFDKSRNQKLSSYTTPTIGW